MALLPTLVPWLLTLVEAALLFTALVMVGLRPRRNTGQGNFPPAYSSFARHKVRAALSVGLLTIVLRIALIPILGVPQPRWNDEFSFLLAAKTFAAGRLTNPTHPLWRHFETFHVIQQPTYMSMYPPGYGLVLAVGERVAHTPWLGVLLITAIACSALCWMLQGWVPPEWALFGGLLAVFRLGILSYWMNSYWCPGLAATGGALVLGASPRLRSRPTLRAAFGMAFGLAILANSRPYEGLLFSLPFAFVLLGWLIRGRARPAAQSFRPAAAVLALLLLVAAVATGYYNWWVTGNPFRLAYQVNRETYAVAPYFIMFPERPAPHYDHAVMRDYYLEWEGHEFRNYHTLAGFLQNTGHKAVELWRFYLGPVLTIPLLAFPFLFRDRRMRFPLQIALFFTCGLLIQTWTFPHYIAPATGLIYLLLIQCMRHLRLWTWGCRTVGIDLIRTIALVSVGVVFLRVVAAAVHAPIEPSWPRGNLDRPRIIAQLDSLPEPQLVFVRYGPHHDVTYEWVFNEPDIDHSKIVWAHDMGPDNAEVLSYFPDRQVQFLNADETPPRLLPAP
jgi:hypothetical protein